MKIEVVDCSEEAGVIRYLLVDGKKETASYIDERKNELIFPYSLLIAEELKRMLANKVLLLGGGGFSIPKYYVSHFLNGTIDVVEIEQEIIDIAKKSFFVADLIRDYQTEEQGRMRIILGNGRDYVQTTNEVYDMIINDAYRAGEMANEILENSCVEQIAEHLIKGGRYIINMFTALEGPKKVAWDKEKTILDKFFMYSTIVQVNPEIPANTRQNCLVIAIK